jgi:hypothetical protein
MGLVQPTGRLTGYVLSVKPSAKRLRLLIDTVLPMHGAKKEIGKGLEHRIKRDLELK